MDATPAQPTEYIWYLAYGSNMNPAVLTTRRGVHPIESHPCRVPGYTLDSHIRGVPFLEPAFFSVSKRTSEADVELHGVAHKITKKAYDHIRATEGGGGHPTLGYQDEKLKAVFYDGTQVECITLKVSDRSSQPGFIVSSRYLALCVAGALHHRVDEKYIIWLQGLPTYVQRPRQFIGCIVIILLFGPIIVPLYLSGYVARRFLKIRIYRHYELLHYAMNTIWFLHTYFFSFIFGDGGTLAGQARIARRQIAPSL